MNHSCEEITKHEDIHPTSETSHFAVELKDVDNACPSDEVCTEKKKPKACKLCKTTSTPIWRSNCNDKDVLCNACGVKDMFDKKFSKVKSKFKLNSKCKMCGTNCPLNLLKAIHRSTKSHNRHAKTKRRQSNYKSPLLNRKDIPKAKMEKPNDKDRSPIQSDSLAELMNSVEKVLEVEKYMSPMELYLNKFRKTIDSLENSYIKSLNQLETQIYQKIDHLNSSLECHTCIDIQNTNNNGAKNAHPNFLSPSMENFSKNSHLDDKAHFNAKDEQIPTEHPKSTESHPNSNFDGTFTPNLSASNPDDNSFTFQISQSFQLCDLLYQNISKKLESIKTELCSYISHPTSIILAKMGDINAELMEIKNSKIFSPANYTDQNKFALLAKLNQFIFNSIESLQIIHNNIGITFGQRVEEEECSYRNSAYMLVQNMEMALHEIFEPFIRQIEDSKKKIAVQTDQFNLQISILDGILPNKYHRS